VSFLLECTRIGHQCIWKDSRVVVKKEKNWRFAVRHANVSRVAQTGCCGKNVLWCYPRELSFADGFSAALASILNNDYGA
jgi:hypothetical protein